MSEAKVCSGCGRQPQEREVSYGAFATHGPAQVELQGMERICVTPGCRFEGRKPLLVKPG